MSNEATNSIATTPPSLPLLEADERRLVHNPVRQQIFIILEDLNQLHVDRDPRRCGFP